MDTQGVIGCIYLIHFDRRIGGPGRNGAQHYVGWSADLPSRIDTHDKGDGAKILAYCVGNGIVFSVVAQWAGTRSAERRLKKNGHHDRRCPVCRAARIIEASVAIPAQDMLG